MENKSNNTGLVLVRSFNAPKQAVFNAFAHPDAVAEWWGPAGMQLHIVSFRFEPGGVCHYRTDMFGMSAYGKLVYGDIREPDLIEFTSSFSDENSGVTRAPFSNQFPLEIFNRIEFSEEDGKTTIHMTGEAVNATEEEQQFFASMSAGMQQGFEGTFNQLDAYLAKSK